MSAVLCVIVVSLQISRSWQILPTCTEVLDHASCRLLPRLDRCGRQVQFPQARVFGGVGARLGEYPWIARLGYIRRDIYKSPVAYRCGGSVISDRYVLTAAHCCYLDRKTQLLTVRLGELDTTKTDDCPRGMCTAPAQNYKVESFTVHEGYNTSTLHNDICLVRLKYPVEFNTYVSPVCLPYLEEVIKAVGGTFTLETAGWGRSYERSEGTYGKPDVLQKLRMPLVPLLTCQFMYQLMGIEVTSDQLCAGGIPGENVCGGDSGGPLMARYSEKESPHFLLVGVTSFSEIQPCAGKFPSVYVNVLKYIKWILDNMTP